MRVAVFGGTGPAGKLLVDELLAQRHTVVAYARSPEKLPAREGLTVVKGELDDAGAIDGVVRSCEAVVSLLGPSGKVVPGALVRGTESILSSMRSHGVRRIVALATPSARDPDDGSSFVFSFLVTMVRTFVRAAYDEIVGIAAAVRASDREWVLVRVPFLTDTPATGHIRAGRPGGNVGTTLSRADLAKFAVEQLVSSAWVRRAPLISGP